MEQCANTEKTSQTGAAKISWRTPRKQNSQTGATNNSCPQYFHPTSLKRVLLEDREAKSCIHGPRYRNQIETYTYIQLEFTTTLLIRTFDENNMFYV